MVLVIFPPTAAAPFFSGVDTAGGIKLKRKDREKEKPIINNIKIKILSSVTVRRDVLLHFCVLMFCDTVHCTGLMSMAHVLPPADPG